MDSAAKTESSNGPDSSRGIGQLPVELIDAILESVGEDKETILACSWVSRLWHEIFLPYLFASLKVVSKYDFLDFHGFLEMHPEIALHVRKLQLKFAYTGKWTYRLKPQDDVPIVGRTELCVLVTLLPRLQELHLYDLWLDDESPDPAPDTPNHLSNRTLEKLTLERCSVPWPTEASPSLVAILSIISVFDFINTVELLAMQIPTPGLPVPGCARPIRTLNVATLIAGDLSQVDTPLSIRVLFDPLCAFLAPGCLRSLELECFGAQVVHKSAAELRLTFGELVESAARDALHIHVPFLLSLPQIGPNADPPEHWRALNLGVCTSLRSLTLDILIHRSDARPAPGWMDTPHPSVDQACHALLAHIPATIRVLTLRFWRLDTHWLAEFDNATSLGLHALDAALAERFEHLERVEVMIREDLCFDMDGSSSALPAAMPELRAKGILKVVPWAPEIV